MDHKVYQSYRKELNVVSVKSYKGYMHLGVFFALTTLGISLSLQSSYLLYLLGQAFLILSFLNGQILLHEMGHGFFIQNKKVNHFFGYIVALSPIIPYKPWVLIHGQHHRWSGNKHKDPTTVSKSFEDLKESEKKVMNFCWKYWIPIFGLSYSVRAFWNFKMLKSLFPKSQKSIIASMILPVIFYGVLVSLSPLLFLKVWLPAYYLFMAFSEPLLFSQHVHVDQADTRDENFEHDSSYHVKDHDVFSRNLVFPEWVSNWILLGFNKHAIHHIFPNLPGYEFSRIKETFPNTMDWKTWYSLSKSTDAATLLFKTNKQTGLIKGQV